MLTRARGRTVRVVNDIFFSPTWTGDLAEKTWALLVGSRGGGNLSPANGGGCSWYEFARAVLETAGVTATVAPLSSSQWPGKMRRSPDTRLASVRCGSLGLAPLRPWREALSAYLRPATG
jgi:dTDP-4-dehydrorhamnose reductase